MSKQKQERTNQTVTVDRLLLLKVDYALKLYISTLEKFTKHSASDSAYQYNAELKRFEPSNVNNVEVSSLQKEVIQVNQLRDEIRAVLHG